MRPLDEIQGIFKDRTPENYSDKEYIYDEMVKLLGELNQAFYVDGTSKALRPVMAKTKMLLLQARLLQVAKGK